MSSQNTRKVPCVFVHGWAMNSAVWEPCLRFLPDWIDIIRIDLPGHGTMADVDAKSLDDYVQPLIAITHRPVIWVGWSLGGLAVLHLAKHYPERVAGLFMVATNPCFVKRPGWKNAVDAAVFDQFAESLEQDVDATLKRFLALQVRGSGATMQTARELQKAMQQRGRPTLESLKQGLEILATTDLRNSLSSLHCPVTWLLGERDALVPHSLSSELANLQSRIRAIVLPGAAHAPFVSHPEQFTDAFVDFVEELR